MSQTTNTFLVNYCLDIRYLYYVIENVLFGVLHTYNSSQPFPLDLRDILGLLAYTGTILNMDIHILLICINILHGDDELFSNELLFFLCPESMWYIKSMYFRA